jgi:hypothetical protein
MSWRAQAARAASSAFRPVMWSCLAASGSMYRQKRAKRPPPRRAAIYGWSVPDGRRRGRKNLHDGRKNFWSRQEPPRRRDVDCQAPGEAPQPLTLNHPASNPGRVSDRGSSFLEPVGCLRGVLCVAKAGAGRADSSDGWRPGSLFGCFNRLGVAAVINGGGPLGRRDEPSRPGPKSRGSTRYRPRSGP